MSTSRPEPPRASPVAELALTQAIASGCAGITWASANGCGNRTPSSRLHQALVIKWHQVVVHPQGGPGNVADNQESPSTGGEPRPLLRASSALALAASSLFGLVGCGETTSATTPDAGITATAEATPSSTPEVTTPVETLQPRETSLTPEALSGMTHDQLVAATQISKEQYPSIEAYMNQYVLLESVYRNAGTSESELGILFEQGLPALEALANEYVATFAEALFTDPDSIVSSGQTTRIMINADSADSLGEGPYITRVDLCSINSTTGSVEQGDFIVDFTERRRDNMDSLPLTKQNILDNTGDYERSSGIDFLSSISIHVVEVDGNWKISEIVDTHPEPDQDPEQFCPQP